MKTHYVVSNRVIVRYWYDRSIRSWTAHAVTSADDNGDQIGNSHYSYSRCGLDAAIESASLSVA
jgi:hypothetical protein